jgi:hypothetical protein
VLDAMLATSVNGLATVNISRRKSAEKNIDVHISE